LAERPFGAVPHFFLDATLYLVEVFLREDAALFHARPEDLDGVFAGPLLELFLRSVAAVVVVSGVGPETVALRLDQKRARATPRLVDRRLHVLVDGDGVHPVYDRRLDAVPLRPVRHVGGGHLLVGTLRNRIAVVLDIEDHGQAMDGREVERLVEVAPAGA